MALNFPDNPTTGQLYADSTSGFTYQWDGVVWKSYTAAAAANIRIIDDIESSFNGSTTTFALTSSGAPVTPVSPQQLRIVLGGIVQEPAVDYNIAGSNIIFTTAPTTGLSFSGVLLGSAISPVGLASTGSVYYRQSYSPTGVQTTFTVSGGYRVGYLDVYHNGVKLVVTDDYTATNGTTFDLVTPANNGDTVEAVTFLYTQLYSTTGILDNLFVNGNTTVTGITTLGNTVVGGGTTQLLVNGDARVTGILTVGTSSITLDGTNNEIKIGTGLTISSSGITGTASTVTSAAVSYGLEGTPNITVGFITATGTSVSGDVTVGGNVSIAGTLTYEDVTNIDSVGLITARSGVNVTGGDVTLSIGSSIGIGTDNPTTQLEILGSASGGSSYSAIKINNSNFGGGSIDFSNSTTANLGSISLITEDLSAGVYNDGILVFKTAADASNTERFRIASRGAWGLSGANYGTSGQVLTSQGSAAAPQWATPSGGAWTYISSVTANNSASVAFTSGIDSTYDVYVITFTKVTPATNDNLLFLRTSSNGGSSYDSGGTDYVTVGSDNAAELIVSYDIRNVVSTGGANGTIHIFNAGDSGRYTQFNFEGVKYRRDISNEIQIGSQGIRKSAAVVNAIQFFANSNLTTGTFRLYGIKNS